MSTLAVLIAIWKRPAVTAVVMRHYQRMAAARKDLHLVAVGSEGQLSMDLAMSNGWDYVEAPNAPLSDKLAVGLARCRELAPSAGLLAMGSDDLVTETWVERCARATTMQGLRDMYLISCQTWEGLHWLGYTGARAGESVGAHRFFPRAVLDQLDWNLWPLGLTRGLDRSLSKRLASMCSVQALSMQEASCTALGIQSELNLTPWVYIAREARSVPPDRIISQFPEATRAEIMKLRG